MSNFTLCAAFFFWHLTATQVGWWWLQLLMFGVGGRKQTGFPWRSSQWAWRGGGRAPSLSGILGPFQSSSGKRYKSPPPPPLKGRGQALLKGGGADDALTNGHRLTWQPPVMQPPPAAQLNPWRWGLPHRGVAELCKPSLWKVHLLPDGSPTGATTAKGAQGLSPEGWGWFASPSSLVFPFLARS